MRSETERARPWRRHLLILLIVAVSTTAVFWLTDLDIRVASLFYDAAYPGGSWPQENAPLWAALYEADTYFTVVLGLAAVVLIISGARRPGDRRRIFYGLFIILSVSIGAGLLVNGLLKGHWGHPRPDEIIEFGGDRSYAPPWAKLAPGNGESFPSGHAAIAFSFMVFYFLLRIPRPGLARACFLGAVLLGCLAGLGRMAQGRHFLSDVLWSAYIPYLVCLILYFWVLKIPERQLVNSKAPPKQSS